MKLSEWLDQMNFRGIGRALTYRNFRLFFIGQTTSLIGSWMQQVAMSWLVFQLTGSSFLLGIVLFLSQIPCLFLPALLGVYMDRWDKHKVLIWTQIAAMAQAFLLALLTLTHVVAVWHIMALSFFMGIVISFDMPARHAFTVEMVPDRRYLANAVPLSAVMFNGARLIGPALGGFVLAVTSTGICFLINALSFLAVLYSLWIMDLSERPLHMSEEQPKMQVKEGMLYAWKFFPIRAILLLLALCGVTSSAITVTMPELTVSILKGDAAVLGWLTSAMGLGALLAGLLLAARQSAMGLGNWIAAGVLMMGGGMLVIPFVSFLPLSLFLMFVTGFGLVVHISAGNTILQTIADEDKRGQIMSFYTIAVVGCVPVGSLISGALADGLGVQGAMTIMGGLSIIGGGLFLKILPHVGRDLRDVLLKLKIVPPAI